MFRWLINALHDPLTKNINPDAPERLNLHAQQMARKPMLKDLHDEFHRLFIALDQQFLSGTGLSIELGAGSVPMRWNAPHILSTDVLRGPNIDRIVDAQNMDLKEGSVRTIYGINCFHHFSKPDLFLSELERVLVPGGGAILLEPYFGFLAKKIFKRLPTSEIYDTETPLWDQPMKGPMTGANQALSYVIFVRDHERFEITHPLLELVHHHLCGNYLRYIFSGGLTFRQLCPTALAPVLALVEFVLKPFRRTLSLYHIIVIRKKH